MSFKQKSRSEIDDKFKWSLNDLYSSDDEWKKDYDKVIDGLKKFKDYKEKLSNPEVLLECLNYEAQISQMAGRVLVYATMKSHEDGNVSLYQGMSDKAESMISKLSMVTAFIEPELISLDEKEVTNLINNNKELNVYKHYIENLVRQKEHVLNHELEELLASVSEITQSADNIFSMLNNADITFGVVTDEDGNEVEITHGKFTSLLESKDINVRKETFNIYYDAYINQKNTLAAIYNASVKMDVFYSNARKYDSALDLALSNDNIPKEVYTNLIKTVHEYLPVMYKYISKRKELLKLDEIHAYDLYTPVVSDVNTKTSYEDAKETLLKAFEPLGNDYVSKVKEGFENGWIDVYESKGKKSGAYSWGTYGCHPFVLLNYHNRINDMFTLAHEMGHAMHSYYTWETQPYVYSNYTIFVAEVASTVNECLLMHYLTETTKDENKKRYLINYFIEQFKGTVFRQVMFAEFEMITHDMVEKGEPLTVESLNKLYRELNIKYYGKEIIIDEKLDIEWARIPHFYNAFYVYQYATGFSAAVSLSNEILNKGEKAVNKYINFLKSGSSDYSINLLKGAGVDMSSTQPIKEALKVFEELVEKL